MAKNIREIPYTEMQERIMDLGRVPENTKQKLRGIIQDLYLREIGLKWDWDFLITESSITTEKSYDTGTVSIDTGDNAATFASATITTGMTGKQIKMSGGAAVHKFTYVSTSDGTVKPFFEGTKNLSGVSYSISQPVYSLAGDFERFPKTNADEKCGGATGLYRWTGAKPDPIFRKSYQEFMNNYEATPGTPSRFRILSPNTAGEIQVEVNPPPKNAENLRYDYIRQLAPLRETSAGVVTISAAGTTVTGSTACRFTDATTGDWIRCTDLGVGADSEWFRVLAITHDSSLTLSAAFANTAVTSANFVISSAPDMPAKLHPAIMYGALRAVILDQNDHNIQLYEFKYKEALDDAVTLYVTRQYAQEFDTIATEEDYRK
jgi:hypothetical protein